MLCWLFVNAQKQDLERPGAQAARFAVQQQCTGEYFVNEILHGTEWLVTQRCVSNRCNGSWIVSGESARGL